VNIFPSISLFQMAVITQVINAVALPPVFYYLIKLTSSKEVMGEFANNRFQKYFAILCTIVILAASLFTMAAVVFRL
jgi:manganese transport protein